MVQKRCVLKGELKSKISNISKVKYVGLFLIVFCFLRENYVRSWAFPVVSAFSVRAQKLNQQLAVTYDMENRDFVIKRNK